MESRLYREGGAYLCHFPVPFPSLNHMGPHLSNSMTFGILLSLYYFEVYNDIFLSPLPFSFLGEIAHNKGIPIYQKKKKKKNSDVSPAVKHNREYTSMTDHSYFSITHFLHWIPWPFPHLQGLLLLGSCSCLHVQGHLRPLDLGLSQDRNSGCLCFMGRRLERAALKFTVTILLQSLPPSIGITGVSHLAQLAWLFK